MRFIKLLAISFISLNVSGQTKECVSGKATFTINNSPVRDTLSDLILTLNAPRFITGLEHVVFVNKPASVINYTAEGADVCALNDSTLQIKPVKREWRFVYAEGKGYKNALMPLVDVLVFMDDQLQLRDKELFHFNIVDSLYFKLAQEEFLAWYPQEQFRFLVKDLHATLVRDKKVIAQKKFNPGTGFYIRDVLVKGRPGDRLVIFYYPVWLNSNGESRYFSCGGVLNYTLNK